MKDESWSYSKSHKLVDKSGVIAAGGVLAALDVHVRQWWALLSELECGLAGGRRQAGSVPASRFQRLYQATPLRGSRSEEEGGVPQFGQNQWLCRLQPD